MKARPLSKLTSLALLCALVACGGTSRSPRQQAADPEAAERAAAQARREELERSRPASPLVTRRRAGYRARERCGQGPYRLEIASLDARYAEQLVVYACGPRAVSGAARLTVTEAYGKPRVDERTYGGSGDNEACVAAPGEQVTRAPADATPEPTPPAGRGARRGARAKTAKAPVEVPPSLEAVQVVPSQCQIRSSILDNRWWMDDGVPLPRARLVLELWSELPNDLDGVVFVVEQRAPPAAMTLEQWTAYTADEARWYQRYKAFSDEELRTGRSIALDTTVRAPTPPAPRLETPPLRPSAHATWVPGYWHYEGGEYHWLSGFWRTPASDIAEHLTVEAPRPPPPPRPEPAARQLAAPSARAVWTPGYWQWDGAAFRWVEGAWRIPPSERHTWVPTRWKATASGAILAPGGWSIRFGR
ncbi:MAG: YXWGXW repeat-containing protein [Kofleriaceae bacterium]